MGHKKHFINLLVSVLLTFVIGVSCFNWLDVNRKTESNKESEIRTVSLEQESVDYAAILEDFDQSKLTQEGSVTSFEGYKQIDPDILKEVENLSLSEKVEAETCSVKYDMTYDNLTNIVTIAASMKNALGNINMDKIEGFAFINDNGEIDAIMDIEGEKILLSEMKEFGMIENCGWFSRLIRKVAVAVVAVSVVVAVVAVAVVAAPAVVAVGVGTISAAGVAMATTVATTALTVAAIAAGTAILADAIEFTFESVRYICQELTDAIRYELKQGLYFLAVARTDNGKMLVSTIAVSRSVAANAMKAGISVYTPSFADAYEVAKLASDGLTPVHDYAHSIGYFDHYHRAFRKGVAHAFYGAPRLV